jgi:PTS system nitrogen regulatory IIA component
MKLTDFISERSVSADLAATDKERVLAELSALLAEGARGIRDEDILDALGARERVVTTGIGDGVAIPHARLRGVKRVVAAVGISKDGIDFDAVDGAPVRVFVGLLSPETGGAGEHLKILSRLSHLLRDAAFRERLVTEGSAAGIIAAFAAADEKD